MNRPRTYIYYTLQFTGLTGNLYRQHFESRLTRAAAYHELPRYARNPVMLRTASPYPLTVHL